MRVSVAAACAMLAICADTAAAQPVVLHGLTFPEQIGPYARGPVTNHERGQAGSGYSVAYLRDVWIASVFIYDRGLQSVPDDAHSEPLQQEFEQAKQGILSGQAGAYAKVEFKNAYLVAGIDARDRFRCGAFELTRANGFVFDSHICLTSWNSKFVTLWLTHPRAASNDLEIRGFAYVWTRILWPGARAN